MMSVIQAVLADEAFRNAIVGIVGAVSTWVLVTVQRKTKIEADQKANLAIIEAIQRAVKAALASGGNTSARTIANQIMENMPQRVADVGLNKPGGFDRLTKLVVDSLNREKKG